MDFRHVTFVYSGRDTSSPNQGENERKGVKGRWPAPVVELQMPPQKTRRNQPENESLSELILPQEK